MGCIINDDNPIDIIFGCTDPLAINYFSGATQDDGSCFYEGDTIIGCTDPTALNYNPFANFDNGKVCEYEDCPNEITIRPTDGAVFYTNTDLPSDNPSDVPTEVTTIEFTGQNILKGQAPPQQAPQSVPLSENCCTESVVGEPVTWNSQLSLCIVNRDTVCPEPLAVSVDGYVIGFDGEPVDETCCNQIDTTVWDPNFIIPNSRLVERRGACIDSSFTIIEDCDLSFSDLNLNNDGTITYTEEIIVDTGGGDTGGDDTGGDGNGGDNPDFCVSIQDWTLVDPYSTITGEAYPGFTETTKFFSFDTTDIGQLQIGQQIELSGFNTNPNNTCWNITNPNNFNGLVVTILDIIDLSQSTFGVYTVITDLDLTSFYDNNTCTDPLGNDLSITEESAQACIIYTDNGGGTGGDGTGGDDTGGCFPLAEFSGCDFINIDFFSGNGILENPLYPAGWQNTWCGGGWPTDLNYLTILEGEFVANIELLVDCDTYFLNEDFWLALNNSCAGQYVTSSGYGSLGSLSTQDLTQIPVQVLFSNINTGVQNPSVVLDLTLTNTEKDQCNNTTFLNGNFSFCDPTKSIGGGNKSGQNNQKSLECVISSGFEFQRLDQLGNILGDPNYTTWCNEQGLNESDYYLAVLFDPNDIGLMVECQEYAYTTTFSDAITNSCWGQPWSYQVEDQGGNLTTVNGQLQLPQSNTIKLLKAGISNNLGIAVFNVSLTEFAGSSIEAGGCEYVPVQTNFELCTNIDNGGDTGGGDTGGGDTGGGDTGGLGGFDISDLIGDLIGDLIDGGLGGGENTSQETNLSEACCNELGNGLWTYIDGVCYWKPPLTPESVSIGISENDVIVTDPRCNNLTVCLSLFFEQPDDPECYNPNTSSINGSLGFYSGNTVDTITDENGVVISGGNLGFNVNQITTFNSETDGFCNWVQLCAEIVDYDGTPFKIRLDLDGVLDCCEYDIFVDDISVSCTVQDSIQVSTKNDCPGFTLNKVIDNKKSWVYNDGQVRNRVFAPSRDADIPWRYTNYLEQSGVLEKHSKLVLNSKELYLTFNMCNSEYCDTNLSIFDLIDYKNNFQNFWVKFIEQFVPATTIFVSGEKWCTKPEQICKTYDDCGYDNSLNNSDLGVFEKKSESNGARNKNGSNSGNAYNGDGSVEYDRTGDYGDNKSDGPIILGDNFFGVFITDDPSTIETELTFPKGLVPLLEKGTDNFRNRINNRPTSRITRA